MKRVSKLKLKHETVRELAGSHLAAVNGGVFTDRGCGPDNGSALCSVGCPGGGGGTVPHTFDVDCPPLVTF